MKNSVEPPQPKNNPFFSFLSQSITDHGGFLFQIQNQAACILFVLLINLGVKSAVFPFLTALKELGPQQQLWQWIKHIYRKKSFDLVWGFYYHHRVPALENQLITHKRAAGKTELNLHVFSLLVLNNASELLHPEPQICILLLFFTQDSAPQVRINALAALKTVRSQPAFDLICAFWIKNRDPQLTDILKNTKLTPSKNIKHFTYISLLRENFDPNQYNSAEHLRQLIQILREEKNHLGENAGYILRNLNTPALINQFCEIWFSTRHKALEKILLHSQYSASAPDNLFVITRLKLNKNLNLLKITTERVPLLITCLNDQDSEIRQNAQALLTDLSIPDAQTKLLEIFLETTSETLLPVITKLKFTPERLDLLAMVYFLAELWPKYEGIDFNQQILSTFFQNAPENLREKILRTIQKSGKVQFTGVLISGSGNTKIKSLSYEEAKSTIRLLIQYEKWDQLWLLSQITFPDLSFEIFNKLKEQHWLPQNEPEKQFFLECSQILSGLTTIDLDQTIQTIPFAIPISVLNFKGRINDIAFSPQQKILAMATNQRAVLLWNYNKGKAQQLIRGFNHSIGLLNYGQQGRLYIGEKTNSSDYCDLWLWDQEKLSLIGFHQGSLTSITPVSPELVVTSGKDERLVAWNTNTKSILKEEKIGWWPRAVLYQPSKNALSIYNTFGMDFSVPDFKMLPFKFVQSNPKIRNSVIREALITKSTQEQITGQNNGQIVLDRFNPEKQFHQQVLIHQLSGNLIGLSATPEPDQFLALSNTGEIHLFDLNGQVRVLQQYVSDHFTSFQISPDQTLFATGTKYAKTILWDLRPIHAGHILRKSLNDISNPQWAVLKFIEKSAQLDSASRVFLHYTNRLLENRFKYDIELSGIDQLSPGEFDIEIE